MSTDDPMSLMNDALTDATKRLVEQQKEFTDEYVTRPAVGEKLSPNDAHRAYVLTRNNEPAIDALVAQYGLPRTIQMLKDGERKLQRRQGNG